MDNNTIINLLKQTLMLGDFKNNPTIRIAFANAFDKLSDYDRLKDENKLLKEKIEEYELEKEDDFGER